MSSVTRHQASITVTHMGQLRAMAPGKYPIVSVASYHDDPQAEEQGTYVWNFADISADNGGTVIIPNAGGTGRWNLVLTGPVSPRQFGALYDGTGDTPADYGVDISTAPWNDWAWTEFVLNIAYSPFNTAGGLPFAPPRATPFANTDTWDYIGTSLAFWSQLTGAVSLPRGEAVINVGDAYKDGSTFTGIIIMRGQVRTVIGEGRNATSFTTKENAAFFAANNFGTINAYQLITTYRMGGPIITLRDFAAGAPSGYSLANMNVTAFLGLSANGHYLQNLYLGAGEYGAYFDTYGSDNHVESCTFEGIGHAGVYGVAGTSTFVKNCGFGGGAGLTSRQYGVVSAGQLQVSGSLFWDMGGGAASGVTGKFINNQVVVSGAGQAVQFTDAAMIIGNDFTGSTAQNPMVSIVKNSTVTGNTFNDAAGGVNQILSLGDGSALSATNNVIANNTFIKADATSAAGNYCIIAPVTGVNNFGAITPSTIIGPNVFTGRALTTIGNATNTATVMPQTINGVPQPGFNYIQQTVANNGTYDLPIASGMVLVQNISTGNLGMFIAGGSVTLLVAQNAGTTFTVTVGNATTSNFYFNAGTQTYRLQNLTGSSAVYNICILASYTNV